MLKTLALGGLFICAGLSAATVDCRKELLGKPVFAETVWTSETPSSVLAEQARTLHLSEHGVATLLNHPRYGALVAQALLFHDWTLSDEGQAINARTAQLINQERDAIAAKQSAALAERVKSKFDELHKTRPRYNAGWVYKPGHEPEVDAITSFEPVEVPEAVLTPPIEHYRRAVREIGPSALYRPDFVELLLANYEVQPIAIPTLADIEGLLDRVQSAAWMKHHLGRVFGQFPTHLGGKKSAGQFFEWISRPIYNAGAYGSTNSVKGRLTNFHKFVANILVAVGHCVFNDTFTRKQIDREIDLELQSTLGGIKFNDPTRQRLTLKVLKATIDSFYGFYLPEREELVTAETLQTYQTTMLKKQIHELQARVDHELAAARAEAIAQGGQKPDSGPTLTREERIAQYRQEKVQRELREADELAAQRETISISLDDTVIMDSPVPAEEPFEDFESLIATRSMTATRAAQILEFYDSLDEDSAIQKRFEQDVREVLSTPRFKDLKSAEVALLKFDVYEIRLPGHNPTRVYFSIDREKGGAVLASAHLKKGMNEQDDYIADAAKAFRDYTFKR